MSNRPVKAAQRQTSPAMGHRLEGAPAAGVCRGAHGHAAVTRPIGRAAVVDSGTYLLYRRSIQQTFAVVRRRAVDGVPMLGADFLRSCVRRLRSRGEGADFVFDNGKAHIDSKPYPRNKFT